MSSNAQWKAIFAQKDILSTANNSYVIAFEIDTYFIYI